MLGSAITSISDILSVGPCVTGHTGVGFVDGELVINPTAVCFLQVSG